MDAEGQARFARCVHGVEPAPPQGDGGLPPDSAARLRAWGFNALGVVAGGLHEDGLPFMAEVGFAGDGPVLQAPGLRLPDVFDPGWPGGAGKRAQQVCAPLAEDRLLLGWVTDTALEWGQCATEGRPTLLQLCLSLEPRFAAYHAAWEFVLAHHGGRLDTLARAWGVSLSNKEVLREMTRSETGLATRGYARDQCRWTREVARRYFTTAATAVREADPHHLILGCRLRRGEGPEVQAACAYPAVDVAMPDWRDLPPASTAHPFLAGEVSWVDDEFLQAPAGKRAGRSTAVERMLRRARAGLDRVARHPAALGYAWAQWQDGPGEQPPFGRGLVHANGREAREHTDLLTQFNEKVERWRRREPAPASRD